MFANNNHIKHNFMIICHAGFCWPAWGKIGNKASRYASFNYILLV